MQMMEIVRPSIPHQIRRRIALRSVPCVLDIAVEPGMSAGGTDPVPDETEENDDRVHRHDQVDQYVGKEDKVLYGMHRKP